LNQPTDVPRFLYHAQAAGVSGQITRPFYESLPVQAPSALPSGGGYSSGRKKNVRIREVLNVGVVRTQATGSYQKETDSHTTESFATTEQFNVSGIVTADVITASLRSTHPARKDEQPSFSLAGTLITNLRIAGREILLKSYVDLFSELSKHEDIINRYESGSDPDFRNEMQDTGMFGKKEEMKDSRLHRFFPWCHHAPSQTLPHHRGATVLPLFKVLNPSEPGFTVHGNVVYVEDFGRIQIGQLVVEAYERRVTMLHVNLGSPVDGDIESCSIIANGGPANPDSR
jgi:hypothetical protein